MNGSAKLNKKRPNDPKRFISQTSYTPDGEIAQATSCSLNLEMIAQEELFDGFYAIRTDLEDDALAIIKANAGRWIIENGFYAKTSSSQDLYIYREMTGLKHTSSHASLRFCYINIWRKSSIGG